MQRLSLVTIFASAAPTLPCTTNPIQPVSVGVWYGRRRRRRLNGTGLATADNTIRPFIPIGKGVGTRGRLITPQKKVV